MASSKTKLYPNWKQTVKDIVNTFTYEDLISHDWLRQSLQIPVLENGTRKEFQKNQMLYTNAVESIRKKLLKTHLMDLTSVWGEGYTIIHPRDQTEAAVTDMVHGLHKAMSKGINRLSNIDTLQLTTAEQKANTDALAKAAHLRALTYKGARKLIP